MCLYGAPYLRRALGETVRERDAEDHRLVNDITPPPPPPLTQQPPPPPPPILVQQQQPPPSAADTAVRCSRSRHITRHYGVPITAEFAPTNPLDDSTRFMLIRRVSPLRARWLVSGVGPCRATLGSWRGVAGAPADAVLAGAPADAVRVRNPTIL